MAEQDIDHIRVPAADRSKQRSISRVVNNPNTSSSSPKQHLHRFPPTVPRRYMKRRAPFCASRDVDINRHAQQRLNNLPAGSAGGVMDGLSATPTYGLRIRSRAQQASHDAVVSVLCCQMKRPQPVNVRCIHEAARFHQRRDGLARTSNAGQVQWRLLRIVERVGVGAGLEESGHRVGVAARGHVVEGPRAVAVCRRAIGAEGNEQFGGGVGGGEVEGGVVLLVPGVQDGAVGDEGADGGEVSVFGGVVEERGFAVAVWMVDGTAEG
ncbi:hypothetical protein DIS24_g10807 [Lasiodiplodia hormozganensis]|uniref:Uncharacterized protein n=1 Tax=Lasiodiplodia hormozganensis TaxID=869390 RepID=A0AA39X7A3_9PEZI|nr:hypothetical protein DIS24_g10807 [Lasiodiplodia hormozganensis]